MEFVESAPESVHFRVPFSLVDISTNWTTKVGPMFKIAESPCFACTGSKIKGLALVLKNEVICYREIYAPL